MAMAGPAMIAVVGIVINLVTIFLAMVLQYVGYRSVLSFSVAQRVACAMLAMSSAASLFRWSGLSLFDSVMSLAKAASILVLLVYVIRCYSDGLSHLRSWRSWI